MSDDYAIDAIFHSFDLGERERTIFRRLLETGRQPASALARHCEMPRNTVRGILDALVKKGLLTCTRRAHTQYYGIEKSEGLLAQLQSKKEALAAEIDAQIESIKKYKKVLDQPAGSYNQPKISFYSGFDGLKKVYQDTLTSKTPIRAWASFDSNKEALPKYFETYYARRAKKKIPISGIMPDTKLARQMTIDNTKFLRRCILVPNFHIGPEIQMYDKKVIITSWRDKLGILIESEEIFNTLAAVFDLSYETLLKHYKER